jgi:PAS domain S-box-containing protein
MMQMQIPQNGLSEDAFFQTVFQASPDVAILTRVCDGEIIHVNESFCRITGYTQDEVIGKTTIELQLYAIASDRDAYIDLIAETGILEPRPLGFRCKDGNRRIGLVSARSFWSQGYEYVCASIRDITEQQRMEQEQKERAEELSRLFDTMTQGVVYLSATGSIISANPAAERMLGLRLDELRKCYESGQDWEVIREDGSPLPTHNLPSFTAMRTGEKAGPDTVGFLNKSSQEYIWLSITATPLFRAGGESASQVYLMMEDITAQKKAKQDYELLFREMGDAFTLHEVICDESGRVADSRLLAVNPAFERMTGLKVCDIIGKTLREILPVADADMIQTCGQVALTGKPTTFQNYFADLDKYFRVTVYRPAHMQFACTFTDISHQVRFQQEQERAQEQINRLAHICDVAPSSILVLDKAGKILYANDFASQLHGFSKRELLQMHAQELSHDAINFNDFNGFQQTRELGKFVKTKTVYKRDGTAIPILIYSKPIEWDNKPAILSIGTDLTEQMKAESVLQTSLAQNRRILENLQDAFFQSTFDGDFLMLNPRAAQMFGYASADEMKQCNAISLYAQPEDRVAMYDKLKEGGQVTSHTCQLKHKDGSLFWGSMHVQYLKDESGVIIGAEGLIRDITERRKLEKEVKEQHESIRAANEVLQRRLEQSINAISKIGELRDAYTAGHQRRVQQLAYEIGFRSGMSKDALTNLSYGALVHDIGKIYIASDILNKPGKITNLEYQILQTHVEYSYSVVLEMGLPQEILTMVQQHHERLDGTGYPNKCVGDEIIFESRILAVADVVEAMTSHRPYRPALGIDRALCEIEAGKGVKYDATVVDICLNLFREQGFQFAAEPDQM